MELELKKLEKQLVDLANQVSLARHDLAKDLEADIKERIAGSLYGESSVPSPLY